MKDCEWGRGFGMYGGEEIYMQGQMAKPDGKYHLDDLGFGGTVIWKWIWIK